VRLAAIDVNQPIPLPILAVPSAGRTPTEDPTGEASAAAAVAGPLPQRSLPVPYFKLTIPEPYAFRAATVASPMPVPELSQPAAPATPRTPGK